MPINSRYSRYLSVNAPSDNEDENNPFSEEDNNRPGRGETRTPDPVADDPGGGDSSELELELDESTTEEEQPEEFETTQIIFKEFDFDRDVTNVQRVAEDELFFPNKAVAKPFTTANGFNINEVSAETGYETYNSPVYYLEKTNSDITYMSAMRGESASYATASGSGMTYHYMIRMTQPEGAETYSIDDGINAVTTTTEFDVVSLAREFYKDGIDEEFFGLAIDPSSASTASSDYGVSLDNTTDGLIGLFPYKKEFLTSLGRKHYLYRYTSGEFYNKNSDTFTMPDKDALDTASGALGEVYIDSGIVVLYLDKLTALYGNLAKGDHAFNYVAMVGGNSETNLNSNIYYARLENTEFNYSSNRTFYEDDNPNVIKAKFRNDPRTFPTMIGLYNRKNELVAIGKISQPFEKNGQEEALIRLELAY